MNRPVIVGVMGGGKSSKEEWELAFELGARIAGEGWVLLNGGRKSGVMDASARGAKKAGGITVGILPDADLRRASRYLDIPIVTGMGSARNNINVLTADIIVACNGGTGTISEVALALKSEKFVILLGLDTGNVFRKYKQEGRLLTAGDPSEAIDKIHSVLKMS
jgi:uncharacterized protein (TIGR00725 family)